MRVIYFLVIPPAWCYFVGMGRPGWTKPSFLEGFIYLGEMISLLKDSEHTLNYCPLKMSINSYNTVFPLEENYLKKRLESWGIDLQKVSIRELNRLVDEIASQYEVEFLRFEFGIPGLTPHRMGPEEEIRVLRDEPQALGTYPPFDGVPRLKQATAEFVKNFLNIQVDPKCCVPTVGAMHSGFICQSIASFSTFLYCPFSS